jgi:hypothetical protein
MHVRDMMAVEGPDGDRLAGVHKTLITPLRKRRKVDVETGPDMEVHGDVVDHEYEPEVDDRKIAAVSKQWFRVRDTDGVEIDAGQDRSWYSRSRSPSTRCSPREVRAGTARLPVACGTQASSSASPKLRNSAW